LIRISIEAVRAEVFDRKALFVVPNGAAVIAIWTLAVAGAVCGAVKAVFHLETTVGKPAAFIVLLAGFAQVVDLRVTNPDEICAACFNQLARITGGRTTVATQFSADVDAFQAQDTDLAEAITIAVTRVPEFTVFGNEVLIIEGGVWVHSVGHRTIVGNRLVAITDSIRRVLGTMIAQADVRQFPRRTAR